MHIQNKQIQEITRYGRNGGGTIFSLLQKRCHAQMITVQKKQNKYSLETNERKKYKKYKKSIETGGEKQLLSSLSLFRF
jgi:hypothetical protein